MQHVGIISDTHGYLDPQVLDYFADCDQIWHAGDIGHIDVAQRLSTFKPFYAVHGNIDSKDIRIEYPAHQHLTCEGLKVWITHIAGRPPQYTPTIVEALNANRPDLLVCGHTHILRVIRDPVRKQLLYLNPGAAGRQGHHQVRTLLRCQIEAKAITNMEIIELEHRR